MQDDQSEEESKQPDGAGIFPNYLPLLEEFESYIEWKSYRGKKVPEPRMGVDEDFDAQNAKVKEIRKQLDNYLKDV